MRLAAISVDLDEIPNYFAIHGLAPPAGPGANAVYDVGLGRLDDFARAHGLPLTLFAIGADMAREANARRLRALSEAGHEIANHSLDHLYDLTRRDRTEMWRQVASGITVLEGATGQRPSGFRAPGYTVSDELFAVLAELGVDYDSSVFPCPPYYLAKAVKLGGIRLRGRSSRSVLDRPSVLAAPTRPYRVGKPYWKRGGGLLELPIQVTRGPRLPFIGTTLTLAGAARARWLTRLVLGEPLVNLELHGIDVLDAGDDLGALGPHQVDVRVRVADKLAALGAVVETLKAAGSSFTRLDEAARRFA
ncbi:MAG: polysaccharide deacetylase [Sorangiineae bacterium PRO1]|nr:polysaccharide deacetylase [Sorangiineae bacterium PRO1]